MTADDLFAEISLSAADLGVPGAAVGVVWGGERQVVTVGSTSVDGGRPVDRSTLFQVGSVAKTLTATLLMVLADQGRVMLDQPVARYLPRFGLRDADVGADVTVSHLLNHTAGWDGGDSWPDTGEGDDAVARAAALIADLAQQFRPGTSASYNNSAFVVAGRVAEVVSGETFECALANLVLGPLGLRDTRTALNDIMTHRFALGHRQRDGTGLRVVRPWSDPRGYVPAGARLCCTVENLLDWACFQLGDGRTADGGRLLAEQTLRSMHRPSSQHQLLPGVGIGIGWMLRDVEASDQPGRSVALLEHHGDVAGQHATVTVVPEHDLAIAVLANADLAGRELAERLVRSVLDSRLGLVERTPDPLNLTARELAPYVGGYRTSGVELEIDVGGPALIIRGTLTDDQSVGETVSFPVRLLPEERYVIVDGPFTGMLGQFVREAGEIVAVRHVGRFVPRVHGSVPSAEPEPVPPRLGDT